MQVKLCKVRSFLIVIVPELQKPDEMLRDPGQDFDINAFDAFCVLVADTESVRYA